MLVVSTVSCARMGYLPHAAADGNAAPREVSAGEARTDAAAVLYRQDFSGPTDLVADGFGIWTSSSGVLQQTSCILSLSDAAFPGKSFTDVRVTARARVDKLCAGGVNDAALLFRVAGFTLCDNHYYVCNLDLANGKLELAAYKGSCIASALASAPVALTVGVWYQLEVTARGGELSCTVSGAGPPVTVTSTDPAVIPSGSVGFGVVGVEASFDDLVVTGL